MFAHCNGDSPDDASRDAEVTAGFNRLAANGNCPALNDGENGEGRNEFSWSRCDCCGSRLGGARTRFALFQLVWAP
jgi:hypothetical protein